MLEAVGATMPVEGSISDAAGSFRGRAVGVCSPALPVVRYAEPAHPALSAPEPVQSAEEPTTTFDPVVIASRLRQMGDQCNMDFERVSSEALAEVLNGKVNGTVSCLAWPAPCLWASLVSENSKARGAARLPLQEPGSAGTGAMPHSLPLSCVAVARTEAR